MVKKNKNPLAQVLLDGRCFQGIGSVISLLPFRVVLVFAILI